MKRVVLVAILLSFVVVCGALAEDYVIPEGTLVIEKEAFAGTGFRYDDEDDGGRNSIWYTIRLPEGIQRIEERAFADSGIWLINLPDSLEYIAPDAFDGCEDVCATVSLGSYAQEYCASEDINYEVALPEDTTVIGAGQYAGTTFTSLVLPEGITRIESRAFADSAIQSINFPDSLEYIAPDAFEGVKVFAEDDDEEVEVLFCPKVYPDSVGETYCIESNLPYLTLEEPDLYIVEREFNPITSLVMAPGQTRDGYKGGRGLVLYQWEFGRNGAEYDAVNSYRIDSIEVSASASSYITAGRSEELSSDEFVRIACSDDVPLGGGLYEKLILPSALTVRYTYRGQSLSRSVDILICGQSTMTEFEDYDEEAVVGVPEIYIVKAWTADEDGARLEEIAAFTPHWAVNGVPVDEDGCVFIDGEQIARFEFSDGGTKATVTWLVETEDDSYQLTCADDNAISGNIATMYVEVMPGEAP